jgi:hypothetical protein
MKLDILLIYRINNYSSGGVLKWPPEKVNSDEVDEILKQTYEK